MASESLDHLKSTFGVWRKSKRTRGESIPPELLDRARAAASKFGVNAVRKALNIERRLIELKPAGKKRRGRPRQEAAAPAYSRVELSVPPAIDGHPIMEFETTSGSRLRVFSMTPEALGLLSSLCSSGGGR